MKVLVVPLCTFPCDMMKLGKGAGMLLGSLQTSVAPIVVALWPVPLVTIERSWLPVVSPIVHLQSPSEDDLPLPAVAGERQIHGDARGEAVRRPVHRDGVYQIPPLEVPRVDEAAARAGLEVDVVEVERPDAQILAKEAGHAGAHLLGGGPFPARVRPLGLLGPE